MQVRGPVLNELVIVPIPTAMDADARLEDAV